MASAKSRVAIVTGANKGIGYYIIQGLLKSSDKLTIVLTSRNEELGQQALKKLTEEVPESKNSLHYHQLDVVNDQSVDSFKDWLKEKFGKIDVLINNAGAAIPGEYGNPDNKPTEEQFDYVIGTNYIKTRALTEKLLPLLSEDGKIINISSEVGVWEANGKTTAEAFNKSGFQDKDLEEFIQKYKKTLKEQKLKEEGYSVSVYTMSKALMNAWAAHILPNQVKGDQQVFAVFPGWCKTDLGGWEGPSRTAAQGADTAIYLAELPYKRDESVHGKALMDRKVESYSSTDAIKS